MIVNKTLVPRNVFWESTIDANNLTITNNEVLSSDRGGGGLWLGDHSKLTVTGNLVIDNNKAQQVRRK